jgi:hypothetical protein
VLRGIDAVMVKAPKLNWNKSLDGGLEAGLKVVYLLSLGLGVERQLRVVLQGKLFGVEELGLGGGIVDVGAKKALAEACDGRISLQEACATRCA